MSADLNELRGGAIAINKPAGVTSHDVVNKVRRLYGTKKVGHTGTLDPMATGVLVLLVGRAVKASDLLTNEKKRYRAGLLLGATSDTEDTTGNVEETGMVIPPRDAVIDAVRSFEGEIMQVPPMYSALKRGGQKLVDLARRGITVEREARPVTIYSISADGDGREYTLDVECSKGTYIRTLCADIGKKLGCGGVMSTLTRTAAGGFDISRAVTLEELEKMTVGERMAALIPCEKLFNDLDALSLPDFYARLALNGCEIYQKKIKSDFPVGASVRVYAGREFVGLGEVGEYPDGTAVKIKVFL